MRTSFRPNSSFSKYEKKNRDFRFARGGPFNRGPRLLHPSIPLNQSAVSVSDGPAAACENSLMPVQIGAKRESAFDNPIGLLTDCHRRIENFLSVLLRLGEQARGMPLDSERRASLETSLRYFREAAPKHTADEEDSLFPRLRSIDRADAQRALASIDALESDHAAAALCHAELDELGRRWFESGSLNASDASRFNAVAEKLRALYQAHIAVEESQVFPLASAAIDGNQRLSMGREMAARRGLRKDS